MRVERSSLSTAHVIAVLFLLVLPLASCGAPDPPQLAVDQGGLGVHNALPLITWSPTASARARDAEYSLDGGATWTPVAPGVSEFRPDDPLPAGSYTVTLRYQTISGWSAEASADFTVQNVSPYAPDDEYYAQYQWNLPLIDMPLAWGLLDALFADRDSVVVAVVDTGYLDHPDLVGNVNGAQGYDFIRDIYETDVENDGTGGIDPDAHDAGDDVGDGWGNSWHGTSVAGTIAAVTDNATGVAGVAREKVRILPMRALGVGGGYTYDIAQCIRYAAGLDNDSGTYPVTAAKIINLSLGGGFVTDAYMDTAMQAATDAGAIVVAATGNASDEPDWERVGSPANSPWTIAAGAIGDSSDVSYYSQMSAEVDVVAPGGAMYLDDGVLLPSADPNINPPTLGTYGYYFMQGTSFACPHVAGALAILASIDPDLDLQTARDLLRRSGSNLDEPLIPGLFEIGILNMASLLELHLGGRIASTVERPIFNWVAELGLDAAPVPDPGPADSHATGRRAPPAAADRDETTLIVQFMPDAVAAGSGRATRVAGVQSLQGRTGRARLIALEPGADLEATREALLADPAVEAVYYNYRYYPL